MKIPREENPTRPVATYDRYLKVRKAMQALSAQALQRRGRERWIRMELALVLAEATGARIGAIRGLRWGDVDTGDAPQIRWRAEFDKRGRERVVPIPSALAEEVHRFRVWLKAVADGWLFPRAETDAPWPREIFAQQLRVAEIQAEVPRLTGGLWHTYRRRAESTKPDTPYRRIGL
jgi:integrase